MEHPVGPLEGFLDPHGLVHPGVHHEIFRIQDAGVPDDSQHFLIFPDAVMDGEAPLLQALFQFLRNFFGCPFFHYNDHDNSSCPTFLLFCFFPAGRAIPQKKQTRKESASGFPADETSGTAGCSVSLYGGEGMQFMAAKITKAKIIALGKRKAICSSFDPSGKSHLSTRLYYCWNESIIPLFTQSVNGEMICKKLKRKCVTGVTGYC